MSAPLARIGRLVHVEAQKVLGGRTLRYGVLAVAAVTALTAWTHVTVEGETAWTQTAAALGAGLWAAEIFLLVAGTTTIAGETAQGTLKMILPTPTGARTGSSRRASCSPPKRSCCC